MAVALEIIPFANSLDMYGDPDRRAAYSLSGQINITLSPSMSLFDRKRAAQLLLQSVVVTFEGQSELVSEEMGYTGFRLCSISQELVPRDCIELSCDDLDDISRPATWTLVFNLAVPGWLPESSAFGYRDAGTKYVLHASATIHNSDAAPSRTWLSTLCIPLQSQTRTIKAEPVIIPLRRHTIPPPCSPPSPSAFPVLHYEVSAQPEEISEGSRFPREVLSKIRVQATIPQCVDVDDDKVHFSIRLRTKGLPEAQCRRLRVSEFGIDIEQCERYRNRPSPTYVAQCPVPPKEKQPPLVPLLSPHPLHGIYDHSVTPSHQQNNVLSRAFSLLPSTASGHYLIAGNGYIFSRDSEAEQGNTWFSLGSSVGIASHSEKSDDWKTNRAIRPSSVSPFLSVSHRMYVTLVCTYDTSEGGHPERVTERLRFHVPLKFVRVPPCPADSSRSPSPTLVGHVRSGSESSDSSLASLLPHSSAPYTSKLPPYSHLYHPNGDRKIDYSVPLPLYTPRETSP